MNCVQRNPYSCFVFFYDTRSCESWGMTNGARVVVEIYLQFGDTDEAWTVTDLRSKIEKGVRR